MTRSPIELFWTAKNKKSVEHKELQKEGTSQISTGNTKGTALIDVYPESEKAFSEFED